MVVEVHETENIDNTQRSRGANIRCEQKEVSSTLRAQDHGHPPVLVLGQNTRLRQEASDGK